MKILLTVILVIATIGTGIYVTKEYKIWRYIDEYAIDVIELKDGNKVIGKVTGEIPKEIIIYNPQKNMDEKISKKNILITRKPTVKDLKQLKIALKKSGREKEILYVRKQVIVKNAEYDKNRYLRERSVASRARGDLEGRLAEDKAKEEQGGREFDQQAAVISKPATKKVYYPVKGQVRKSRTAAGGGTEYYWE